jgi:hypothetical protein
MLELVHSLTRAVMRTWVHDVVGELSSMPRPLDEPRAHASGLNPDRILVFGNGLAVGWGVVSNSLAIPGELARALSAITGRGVDVDLLADSGLRGATARQALVGHPVSSYDAIVVFIGSSDGLSHTPRAQWRASMAGLIDALVDWTTASTRIVIVALQPIRPVPPFDNLLGRMANSYAKVLNGITAELCAGRERVRYLVLPPAGEPETERLGTPERYRVWGRYLALHLAPFLNAGAVVEDGAAQASPSPRKERMLPQSDEARYRAIDELGILNEERDERIDRIVESARSLFGTRGAAFSLVARDRQWNKSIAGFDVREVPLDISICAVTIREAAPLIVPDARIDPRFSPDSPTAFYAGYPIESPDGQRIGALCVFDFEPHSPTTVDAAILRDLALQVQHEVWRYWPSSRDLPKTQDLLP